MRGTIRNAPRGARRRLRAWACAAAAAAACALPARGQEAAGAGAGGLRELRGLDHVVLGVNDLRGAAAAYQRLGFVVLPFGPRVEGASSALVDLGSGFLHLLSPAPDSAGGTRPYTFDGGALAQGWEVNRLEPALAGLEGRGTKWTEPEPGALGSADEAARPRPAWRRALPESQPVPGTGLYLVEYDEGEVALQFRAALGEAGVEDPTDHPNGARTLAYVTVATSGLDEVVKRLEGWGLSPAPAVDDQRGSRTVELKLPRGSLYLTAPHGRGGIDDFLEERRERASPAGDGAYEGSILSIGIGVEDLDETMEFLDGRNIPHVPMDLPSGRTAVVQGAPGWSVRLEFVERPEAGSWAAHRSGGGASGARAPSTELAAPATVKAAPSAVAAVPAGGGPR